MSGTTDRLRAGVRQALETAGGFDVVGEAGSGPEVLPLIGRSSPDVLLLDLRMPGSDGFTCLDRIAARYPELKVVVLSASSDLERVQTAFKHGACGYVIKSIDLRDLPSAIRQALDGTAYHAAGLPALSRAPPKQPPCDAREVRHPVVGPHESRRRAGP